MWKMRITGPDSDGLMWIELSHSAKGAVVFSAPVDSVCGRVLKYAQDDRVGIDEQPSILAVD